MPRTTHVVVSGVHMQHVHIDAFDMSSLLENAALLHSYGAEICGNKEEFTFFLEVSKISARLTLFPISPAQDNVVNKQKESSSNLVVNFQHCIANNACTRYSGIE